MAASAGFFRQVQIGIELVHIHIELDRRIGKTFHADLGLDLALQQAAGEIRLHALLQGIHLHAALHLAAHRFVRQLVAGGSHRHAEVAQIELLRFDIARQRRTEFHLESLLGLLHIQIQAQRADLERLRIAFHTGQRQTCDDIAESPIQTWHSASACQPEYLSLVRLSDGASSVTSNLSLTLTPLAFNVNFFAANSCVARFALTSPLACHFQVADIQSRAAGLQFQTLQLILLLVQIERQRGLELRIDIQLGLIGLYAGRQIDLARHADRDASGLEIQILDRVLRAAAFIAIAEIGFFHGY